MGGEGAADSSGGISLRLALGTVLALLVAVRLIPFESVLRGADVVLLSNDPYSFLYQVERALTDGAIVQADPTVYWRRKPLFVWTLALVSLLLGGVDQADLVLAWYPVVTALLSGLLVFVLVRTLTEDLRIALASVVFLAVTPLHVSRTALGFADHHAFDYFWLVLTATALVLLLVRPDAERRRRWSMAGVLGLGVAGQTLAWNASPLLLVPVAVALGVGALVLVRTEDPVGTLVPVVAGFGFAAVAVQLGHRILFWHNAVVAGTPVLLFLGALVLLGLVWFVVRRKRSWPTLLAAEIGAMAVAGVALWLVVPGFVGEALSLVTDFGAYIERHSVTGIGETAGITAAFGPVVGPIVLLGFSPFLGLPAMAWGVLRGWREREVGWLVLAVYVCWFLALAFVQRRFAVQLGIFLSVFAGVGFVGFAHWLALLRPPIPVRDERPSEQPLEPPERERLAILGGLGAIGIGGSTLMASQILSRISIDDSAYQAAAWMREYAAERDWTYPRNYVLAAWGRVRMYNYFVNGQSRKYDYARRHYADFIFSSDEAPWFETFRGRIGFVVTRPRDRTASFQIQDRLHENYGSAADGVDGLGHFRAVWESDDGSAKVFTLVPGARVTGEAEPNTRVTLSTTVTLDGTGKAVEYRRRARSGDDGTFSAVLAQPGEYSITGESGALTVDAAAVRNGAELTVER